MEIKNMGEYNPDYHKDGTLVWKKIGEKTGKKGIRKQKKFNQIDISKIVIPEDMIIDEEVLNASRQQYKQSHKMIPVYLSFDFVLLAGYEQLVLAKELGKSKVCFHRETKLNRKETKAFRKSIQHRKIGNKKYPIRDIDGNAIFVTCNQKNLINACYGLAKKADVKIEIESDFKINILKMDGTILKRNLSPRAAKKYLSKF